MKTIKEDFKLSNSIGHIVNLVANKMKFELENTFASNNHDVTALQWMVLSIIYENNGISQNNLSKKSKKDKTNIARIIDKLEKKDLIRKVKDESDKRIFRLFTTHQGNNLRADLSLLASTVINKSTIGISKEEHKICLKVLKKIYSNLD